MANTAFDYWMPFFRNPSYWIPFYLFLLLLITINYGRKGWWWSLFFICTVALTDLISTQVIKEWVERPRPCQELDLLGRVRLLAIRCAGYSFTSSHAANHFGMAAFFFFTSRPVFGRWSYLIFLWAFLVCFAQIYVGLHFPLDIMGGALLGTGIGYGIARFFNKRFGFTIFDKQPTITG